MKKYMDIYERLKKDITDGVYKTGSRLPSKRLLCEQFGTSVITVEHAYDLLIDEGYVNAVEKRGYFVIYDSMDFFSNDRKGSYSDVFYDRSEFENYFENQTDNEYNGISFDLYSKTVRKVINIYQEDILKKSPPFGNTELRVTLSDYLLRSRGIRVSPENIMIGAGAEYLYSVIVKVIGNDKTYGVETPGYGKIKEVYENERAGTDMLLLGKNGIKSSELQRTKADVLHVTPYRSYPTGVIATAGKKTEYINWSAKKDGIIIEDDFESEFSPSIKAVDTLFSMDNEGRVIYVNTFTRTIAPSVRIAYMIIPDRLLKLFKEKTSFISCPVPTMEQLFVAQLIESGDFERHINRVRRFLRNKKGK
ncbi:MAG: PLP-dependent aminotransferase family protein [Lachnospiraceae bacterium]|nr:PLP-dependent aminotransferase family protein [Lachnospiraceae bacterium]